MSAVRRTPLAPLAALAVLMLAGALLAGPAAAGPSDASIQVSINGGAADYVEGVGFGVDAMVEVTVRDGGDVLFGPQTVQADGGGHFVVTPGVDLQPGMQVEAVQDGGAARMLTLAELSIDDADADSNTVRGSATPDHELTVIGPEDCEGSPAQVQLTVPADGRWVADFTDQGGFDDMADLGAAHLLDDDGDNTLVSNPFRLEVEVNTTTSIVQVWPFNPDDELTAFPAHTVSVTVTNGTTEEFGPVEGGPHAPVAVEVDASLTVGTEVIGRSDTTGFSSALTLVPLTFDTYDPATGRAGGTGDPGTTVEVRLTDGTHVPTVVDGTGRWTGELGDGPIEGAQVLTQDCELDTQVAEYVAAAGPTGPTATPGLNRLAGPERIATSLAISGDLWADTSAQVVVVARHDTYPDSLSGSALAAALGGPLVLTPSDGLWADTAEEIVRVLAPGGTVWLLGGEAALSSAVAEDAAALGVDVRRAQGPTRYHTSVAIAEATTAAPTGIFLADGNDFPEALVAGAAAAHIGGVLVLTNSEVLPEPVADYLATHPDVPQFAVGGAASTAAPAAEAFVGNDRYENARLVADRFYDGPTGVAIASGENFPDGLAGGAHAGTLGFPLLLSPRDGLPQPAIDYLTGDGPFASIYLYGGEAALGTAVADAANGYLG